MSTFLGFESNNFGGEYGLDEEVQAVGFQSSPQRLGTPGVFEQQQVYTRDIAWDWGDGAYHREFQPLLRYGPPLPRSGIIQNAPTIDPMLLTQGYSGNQSISDVNPQFDYGFLNTMPFSDPLYATQEFWSLPAALNSHPSASDFETPHEYFGVLDNPNSYTASLQEANKEENKKLIEILFGELIRDHPDEADSVNDETITPPQSPPANTIGDTENLTLEPQTHNQGSGAPSLAPHQAWPVQSQHQSSTQPPPAISHLPPTYYAADYVPAWGNYCAAALSDPPQGSSSSNSILNHPHTEDLELWISLEDPSTPYQNSTGNILPDDPLDYDKLWNML